MAPKKSSSRKSAVKKTPAKKAPAKKTPAKKAPAKKTPAKKTVKKHVKKTARKAGAKKKTPSKKMPAKKTSAKKTPAKKQAKRHAKPKLGFDPLSREDIDVLTSPGVTGTPLGDEDHITGIDALIRDTSHEQAPAPAAPLFEKRAEKEMPAAAEPIPESDAGAEPKESPASKEPEKAPKPLPQKAALRAQEDEDLADLSTFFSFRLGQESFAIPIERVREVLQYQETTKVPKTPPYMIGVINLRGGVVPVVGLRVLFGMSESERTVHSAVIILDVDNAGELSTIGVLVDSVREVVDIRDTDVAPPPRLGTGINTDFISGMGKLGDEFLMILNIDRAFSVEGLL
jgi:purine-binding chemotaxis protein CheW